MELIGFFILAVLAVSSALVVLTHRNEVICALALAFNLASIAGFYFLLGAQFIGFMQIIVYAGAIMVLIVFVIMLLNLGAEDYPENSGSLQRWLAATLSLLFAAVLAVVLWRVEPSVLQTPDPEFGTVAALGRTLFTRFFYPFEIISLLLVAAMIGAVLLAKRRL